MRDEMNSNRYEISFRLKVSFRCSVSHCGHFDRNEICLSMSIKISGRFKMQLKSNVMSTKLVFTPVHKVVLYLT